MKNFFKILPFLLVFFIFGLTANAVSILTVPQGGSGVGTITGIIQGNGTAPFSPITVGSGLTFAGGTLSANGTPPIITTNYGATLSGVGSSSRHIIFHSGSGATGVNFVTGTGAPVGTIVVLTDEDAIASTSNITVDAGSGNFIVYDDATSQTYVMDQNGLTMTFEKISSTNWKVIGVSLLGSGAVSQPTGQIVYGTGTNITSDANHSIDAATGSVGFNADDLGGDIGSFALGGSGINFATQHTATGATTAFNMFPDPVAFDLTTNDGAGLVSGISASTGNILNILNNGLTWIWPTTDGTTGQVLTTDGAGNLSWTSAGGSGGASGVIVVAQNDVIAQSGDINPLVTYTAPADGTYRIAGYFSNPIALTTTAVHVTYIDEQGNSVNRTLTITLSGGATAAFYNGVGTAAFLDSEIRVQAGSTITVFTSGASNTYDIGSTIEFLGSAGAGSGPLLQVNGTDNVVQSTLNLLNGTNTTIVDNGDGSVTFNANCGIIGETSGVICAPSAISGDETWLGDQAGTGGASTDNTVFIGTSVFGGAGGFATGAYQSTFIGGGTSGGSGGASGNGATNAFQSNFFGNRSGTNAVSANNANFFGDAAGNDAASASFSTFIGDNAGNTATTANNSIFIGTAAGESDTVDNTSNSGHSILIGDNTSTAGFSNSICLGTQCNNDASNEFLVGDLYNPGHGIDIFTVVDSTTQPLFLADTSIFQTPHAVSFSGSQAISSSATMATNIHELYVDPASLVTSLTVTLPFAPQDGQEIEIFFGGQITGSNTPVVTSFTITPSSGDIIIGAGATAIPATTNSFYKFVYNNRYDAWYRAD